jgi:hypothetical protein
MSIENGLSQHHIDMSPDGKDGGGVFFTSRGRAMGSIVIVTSILASHLLSACNSSPDANLATVTDDFNAANTRQSESDPTATLPMTPTPDLEPTVTPTQEIDPSQELLRTVFARPDVANIDDISLERFPNKMEPFTGYDQDKALYYVDNANKILYVEPWQEDFTPEHPFLVDQSESLVLSRNQISENSNEIDDRGRVILNYASQGYRIVLPEQPEVPENDFSRALFKTDSTEMEVLQAFLFLIDGIAVVTVSYETDTVYITYSGGIIPASYVDETGNIEYEVFDSASGNARNAASFWFHLGGMKQIIEVE